MMRAIATGRSGLIALRLVDRLVANGADDDDFDPSSCREAKDINLAEVLRNRRCRRLELDIRDAIGMCVLLSGARPGAIVHLAAPAPVRRRIDDAGRSASGCRAATG
jgi:nucleoside-diphosphate-sugar epimerase